MIIFPIAGLLWAAVQHLVHQDAELHQGGGGGQGHQAWPAAAVSHRQSQEVSLRTGPGQSLK